MKFFLNLAMCFFVWCISFSGLAQDVFIFDAETKEPLVGATISNKDQSFIVYTNLEGKCSLGAFLEKGSLFIKHPFYIDYKISKIQWVQRGRAVYLQRNAFELDEVVMSISKWEQQLNEVPQKIIGVSAQNIAFNQPQTAADLLQQSGKVYVQKSQLGGGSPMIRGFSANRLLLSVDGVRMNNAIFRGGNLQNSISVDPFTIKNTEIIFGSGSVIYGSDALGGVIHYYTKTPQLSKEGAPALSGNAQYRYSSANQENTTHVDVSFSGSKWGFLSSISYSDFSDLKMGKSGPSDYLRLQYVQTEAGQDKLVLNPDNRIQNPTAYNQINVLQKVIFKPSIFLHYSLGVYYSETSDYARYDRLIRPSKDEKGLRSAVWNYGPQKWLMTNFQMSHNPENSFYEGLKFTAAYQKFGESRYDRNFGKTSLYETEESVDALSFNLDFEQRKKASFRLFYGVDFIGNLVGSQGTKTNIATQDMSQTASRYPDQSTWATTALYLNSTYERSETLRFLGGLRYSHVWIDAAFDNQFFDFPFKKATLNTGAFTGSFGLSWFAAEDLHFSWNATTGFRAPNIDDIGKVFESEPGSIVVPNPNLKPEYAYGTEIGVKKNFSDKIVLRTAAYYTHLNEAIVRRDFSFNGQREISFQGSTSNVQAMQNAAKAFVYGWELGLDYFISPFLSFAANYSLVRGEEEEENGDIVRGRHVSPAFGDVQFTYKNSRFKASFVYQFNSEISADMLPPSEQSKAYIYALDKNDKPYSPAWDTLNFRSQYTLSNAITTYVAWENMGNTLYRMYSSGISAPGSNLILGASYQF
ncbi:MAG: hemoglobin/transferrin/lactoferrin receptor protein [Flavobacteriaceae bacterium]|jgi:hemoglobin/transferrin/lactoferrin receptor protein